MIGASTCDKLRDNLSLRRGKLTNMSDDISRSIASAVSQVVQRAVDQALSCLPITSTSATPSLSATFISTTSSLLESPKAGKNVSEQNFSLQASTGTSKATIWQGSTKSHNRLKENVCRTGDFPNTSLM